MEAALDARDAIADPAAWPDGLMLALLTAIPIRIGNFAGIRIGEHLQGGSDEPWRISLAAAETKTRREDTWEVPESLVPYLDHFVAVVRPMLLQAGRGKAEDHGALWVCAFGQPLGPQGVRQRIKAITATKLGRTILPHSFRHSVATAFALRNPDRPRDAASLLGHAGPRTTEGHYIRSERQPARAELQRLIEQRIRDSDGAA